MLRAIQTVLHEFGVDYFLVGAFARDVHLSPSPSFAASRKTKDVDLAILLANEDQFHQIKDTLVKTGAFEEISRNPIKLIYDRRIEVDLLPFGEIESEERQLQLQGGAHITLDMSGFREVYPFIEKHRTSDGLDLNVCPLEGLVLLKLIANDQAPSRTKDITDIEHLIKHYFALNFEDIYTEFPDVFSLYDTDELTYLSLVSARIIGRKLGLLLRDRSGMQDRILAILAKRQTETWQAMRIGLLD
jgi:predicted nucleotidyltransferase